MRRLTRFVCVFLPDFHARSKPFTQADKMRTAAAANKSAHEKLLSETRLQFGRMNSELSLARSERNTLRTQIEQSTSQQAAEQTASDQQLAGLQAQITSLETALTQAKREAEEAKLRLSQSTTAESLSEPLVCRFGHDKNSILTRVRLRLPCRVKSSLCRVKNELSTNNSLQNRLATRKRRQLTIRSLRFVVILSYLSSQLSAISRGSKNVMSACWRITRSSYGRRCVFEGGYIFFSLYPKRCAVLRKHWRRK